MHRRVCFLGVCCIVALVNCQVYRIIRGNLSNDGCGCVGVVGVGGMEWDVFLLFLLSFCGCVGLGGSLMAFVYGDLALICRIRVLFKGRLVNMLVNMVGGLIVRVQSNSTIIGKESQHRSK